MTLYILRIIMIRQHDHMAIMRQKPFSLLSVLLCAGAAFMLLGCGNAAKRSMAFGGYFDTVLNDSVRLIICGRFVENDTVFFLKEYLKDIEGTPLNTAIYIEPDKQSDYYKPEHWLWRFEREGSHREKIGHWLQKRQTQHKPPLQKVDLFGLPTDWIALHVKDGKPYVFEPCETDYPWASRLSDSLLQTKPLDYDLVSWRGSERLSASLYRFRLGDSFEFGAGFFMKYQGGDLFIHQIDSVTKASVWEYRKPDGEGMCQLLIPIESVKHFDMVVCYCPLQKFFDEYVDYGDNIDFKALLQAADSGKVDMLNLPMLADTVDVHK